MLRDRRTQVMLAGVLVAGALAWWYFGGQAAPAAVATERRPQTRAAQGAAEAEAVEVRLGTLDGERGTEPEARRNLFRFGSRAPSSSGGSAPPPASAPTLPVAPPVDTGPPPPPPIQLKFIGLVQRADGLKLAVLTSGENRGPVHGKEGDIIDGRYRILKIGTESVELAYADGRGRQTIRLTGQ